MGNSQAVTAGNKAQANSNACTWFKLFDLHGVGEFVEIMKKCNKRNYGEIDAAIKEKIAPYLYNGGQGKYVSFSEIVHVRSCIKNGLPVTPYVLPKGELEYTSAKDNGHFNGYKKGVRIGPMDPECPDEQHNGVISHPNGRIVGDKRFVCWDIYQRGPVGETILHLCLLLATPLSLDLAKRLIHIYPTLLVDIYLSDQYFGENILHIAIVNEDPAMVKFILDRDKWLTHEEQCFGAFFYCDDQNAHRKDSPHSEKLLLPTKTNYKGFIYWGEYPLSFAACLSQEECLRLLFAKKANPYARDHNGNTVLHMLVIHNNLAMFNLVLSLSSHDLLSIKNNKGLTPLTLAAELAHKEMYNHILEKERDVFWVYGDVTCAAYPLTNIDSIAADGSINPNSALHLIIHGDQPAHLDMVDGMIVNLLNEKWATFVRFRFYRRLAFFIVYFSIFVTALVLRPGTDSYHPSSMQNGTDSNSTIESHNCYLLEYTEETKVETYVRLGFELASVCGAFVYLILLGRNVFFQGKVMFLEMLKADSAMAMFCISCIVVMLMVPGRAFCKFSSNWSVYEDVMAVFSILCTAPYFLFFCRGFKIVGPFVVMIYKMLAGDLLRFFTIYIIFLVGFSQAMYVVHIGWTPPNNASSPFEEPHTALMGMFYMSMGEFSDMYDGFSYTRHAVMAKVIFVLYMILVTLLLINMLIAMMGNTYTQVNETQKEWLRQWAHIVLTVEQTVTPDERKKQQMHYSQPMVDGKRALAVRWHQTEREKEDLKKARDEIKAKHREIILRHSLQGMKPNSVLSKKRHVSAVGSSVRMNSNTRHPVPSESQKATNH